jgi:hypothetical protein
MLPSGTDMKLPSHARAAVTLGPHLVKDALAQAAMRMRLLGKTQSITFLSPPEVHQSILDLRSAANAPGNVPVCSVDVIRWLLEQTCNTIEQLEPLYYNQGISYLQRTQAKLAHADFLVNHESRNAYLSTVRSKEMHSLRQLYEPRCQRRGAAIRPSDFAPTLRSFVMELLQRRKDFQDRGLAIQSAALEEVELEREMEYEIECVREVQQPVHFRALKVAKLHADVEKFAMTGNINLGVMESDANIKKGRMPAGSDAWQPMFCAIQKTALGLKHGAITAASAAAALYVSTQFTRTASVKEPNDNFLRPCHWLLWSSSRDIGLLVSPEEANELIPILDHKHSSLPTCHLILYAPPITRRMLQFNNLDYYAMPPLPHYFKAPIWLKVELGMFAGRLYFEWDEYQEIMSYLGIQVASHEDKDGVQSKSRKPFTAKPLAFLHEWLAVRRKGQDFEHTPMGFVATGKPLYAGHPFFSAPREEGNSNAPVQPVSRLNLSEIDDDEESDEDEDHAKEHLFQHGGSDDGGEEFPDAEQQIDEEENTFFDGGAYVHAEDETEEEG